MVPELDIEWVAPVGQSDADPFWVLVTSYLPNNNINNGIDNKKYNKKLNSTIVYIVCRQSGYFFLVKIKIFQWFVLARPN